MTTEQKIQHYLSQVSKGQVQLPDHIASAIIGLVLDGTDGCRAVLYRFSWMDRQWHVMRTISTTQQEIDIRIREALKHKPADFYYRYDLYNERNEFQGYIYSLNPSLF